MSLAEPDTVTDVAVVVVPSAGESMVMCGGVVSSVIWTVAVLDVPLAPVATALSTFRPSTSGTGIENVPEPCGTEMPLMVRVADGSLSVPFTVTGEKFVTLKFAGEVIVICGAGAYVSVRGEVLVLPATSVA